MSLSDRKPMRGCGKQYPTMQAALDSKRKRVNPKLQAKRCFGCKQWHLRAPERAGAAATTPRPATGFPARVKLQARTRAGGGDPDQACCEACGQWLGRKRGEIQHRDARGAGGSKDPVVNGIANAAVLCRPCHRSCEARDPEMRRRGWWIGAGNGKAQDPRLVPVLVETEHVGAGTRLLYLTEDGGYSEVPPAEAAA